MERNNKWISIILLIAMVSAMVYYGLSSQDENTDVQMKSSNSITIWYTDESMTDYIESAAVAYQEETKVKVIPTLVSGLEYAESINEATISADMGPDMYIITNDLLEKVSCAGLAATIVDQKQIINSTNYPQTAIDAVTYQGKCIGYPLNYETAFLLYNKSLLQQMAELAIQSERDSQAGEEAMEEIANTSEKEEEVKPEEEASENQPITQEEIDSRAESMVPQSIVGILDVAENYDLPEGVETVFKWDISDVFYNYIFAGAYMNVGSKTGDDRQNIDIYNENAMYCLGIYQDMNQFFSMEAKEVSYSEVMQEFIDQKILFTVATSDCLQMMKEEREAGNFDAEYGIGVIKKVNDTLDTGSLSVTNAIAINGYSEQKDRAEDFAAFLSMDYAKNMYLRSGKMPAHYQSEYPMEGMSEIMSCYECAVSLPKFIETANYWIMAEMCYTNIWSGDDVNSSLKELAETIESQIQAQPVVKEEIPTPEIVENYNRETE